MREVILSADGDSTVYLVPDAVAEHLKKYCLEFCTKWLYESPDARKYRVRGYLCYTEKDFIDWLNTYVFPGCGSKPVKNLGWTNLGKDLPAEYRDLPYFNF